MKKVLFFLFCIPVFFLSCITSTDEEDKEENKGITECSEDQECIDKYGPEYSCRQGKCKSDNTPVNSPDDDTDNSKGGEEKPDENHSTDSPSTVCSPGETTPCQYDFPADTVGKDDGNDVRVCRTGVHTCTEKGKWGECEGQVAPKMEDCPDIDGKQNGIDDDCNGVVDDVKDIDGDGFDICSGDCCEVEGSCSNPASVNPGAMEVSKANGYEDNNTDDNCNGEVDEATPSCDGNPTLLIPGNDFSKANQNAQQLAMAMGICNFSVSDEDASFQEEKVWGLIKAELSLAGTPQTETINNVPRPSLALPYYDENFKTYAINPKFGEVIEAKEGENMAILSTGDWDNPTMNAMYATLEAGDMRTSSLVPTDWINFQPNCEAPKSQACGGTPNTGNEKNTCQGKTIAAVQDPIMLTLTIRVPTNAYGFSFNSYFFSVEFPTTVCASFNDFFIALLDSEYLPPEDQPELANPYDMNLAKDDKGNYVGVDLAPAGLFKSCSTDKADYGSKDYSEFCEGIEELAGTGFDTAGGSKHGGTGWLKTRGNVVPGEIITLRLALWEQGTVGYGPDHSWDSTVLLDNFKWELSYGKSGTTEE